MSGNSVNRKIIDKKTVEEAMDILKNRIDYRLRHKGYASFSSRHELNGIIDEEIMELKQISHDDKEGFLFYREELLDIAVAAIFGVACINDDGLEW